MRDIEAYIISRFNSSYIGDDAALIGNICYSVDTFFEDVHFKRSWMNMTQIGRKAMLVNLSDAIAMNAKPLYALVALSLPKDIKISEIEELSDSLVKCAKEFGCEIIGGDTISADKLTISITIISKSDYPLLRKGLKEGDVLAFTGSLGTSKRDLERLFAGESIEANSKFYEPVLRQEFIERSREYLRAGMDISDGLYCDTNKLLDINNIGLELSCDVAEDVGSSGEEYEMLIGFDPANLPQLEQIARQTDTPLTTFGVVQKNIFRFLCKPHHFKS
ncbi:MAG: thiamine-phosphate kinase [Campylobacterales bacterium]|nr:thiamine-phosphate kinase [Campylobacterales bacterium]